MAFARLAVVGASLLVALLAAPPAFAQEDGGAASSGEAQRRRGTRVSSGPFEVFGGFSYMNIDTGGGGGLADGDATGTGFQAQFTYFVNDWFGVSAEFGFHSADLDDLVLIEIFPPPDVDFTQTTVLFGPRFRFARTDRFQAAAHALGGVATAEIDIDFDVLPPLPLEDIPFFITFVGEDTVPAFALGMTFDLRIDERLAWRVVQPDVLVTTYGNDTQTHLRLATGVAFSF